MAEPFFDLTTGTITVKVKAFTRDDAQRVAQKIIGLAEALVNGISLRALRDAVRSNEEEVAQAAEKMRRTRAAVLEFLNRQQLLDPKKEGDERILLMGKMQEQLAKAKTELATLRATMAQDAPTLKVMRHRVTAIEQQIKSTQTQMTSPDIGKTDVLSRSISGDQALATEQLLAEKSYDSALTSLERARALADRQITYLAVFVQPSRPQTAAYPRRAQAIFLTFLGGLGGWLMGLVLYRSVREHI